MSTAEWLELAQTVVLAIIAWLTRRNGRRPHAA